MHAVLRPAPGASTLRSFHAQRAPTASPAIPRHTPSLRMHASPSLVTGDHSQNPIRFPPVSQSPKRCQPSVKARVHAEFSRLSLGLLHVALAP